MASSYNPSIAGSLNTIICFNRMVIYQNRIFSNAVTGIIPQYRNRCPKARSSTSRHVNKTLSRNENCRDLKSIQSTPSPRPESFIDHFQSHLWVAALLFNIICRKQKPSEDNQVHSLQTAKQFNTPPLNDKSLIKFIPFISLQSTPFLHDPSQIPLSDGSLELSCWWMATS